MKTMPAAMFRLLTGQETPMYIWSELDLAEIHNPGHWQMFECSGHLSLFIFTKNNFHHSCCLLTLLKRYGESFLHSVDSVDVLCLLSGCVHSQMKMKMKMELMHLKSFLHNVRGGPLYILFWCYSCLIYLQLCMCGHCWRDASLFCKYVIIISISERNGKARERSPDSRSPKHHALPFQIVCFC